MTTILDKIVATKREEIAAARAARPLAELQAQLADLQAPRDFFAALADPTQESTAPLRLIAEVKKASPSAGIIREDFNPVTIAQTYQQHGASCISVLTDEHYFQGQLSYLTAVKDAVSIPVLRKDFLLDEYQVFEARAAGADAVLLIAECLEPTQLKDLFEAAVDLGMTPLVELYEPDNLPAVLASGARLVGVNNRNLHTFEVDLDHTIRLKQQMPDDCVVVGESGIKTHADVQHLAASGVAAMLVGESLMRQPQIGPAVDALLRG